MFLGEKQLTAENALLEAIKKLNGKTALASKLGIREQNINQWLAGKRRIPPVRAAQIEEATGVSRTQLCPDFPW